MNTIILKSFTCGDNGGNGAGVVILEEPQSEESMQKIAKEVGLSETAFVKKIDDENYEVRFFTPMCEVDLCGHATIAAFYYVGKHMVEDKSKPYETYQHTKAGKLKTIIEFKDEDVSKVLMDQTEPVFFGGVSEKDKLKIAKSLNVDYDNICLQNHKIDIEIVSTGLKDILIPVKNRQILNNIEPNFSLVSEISDEHDACGYHIYTIDEGQIFARNMAPLVGIDEECATGTANGALASLLHKHNIKSGEFDVLQGEKMGELSKISVYVDNETVRVGGSAVEV